MEVSSTREDFINAFWKLYESAPVERIYVNQLCKTAGYNRSTFYNHFENIYNLFETALDYKLEPMSSRIRTAEYFQNILSDGLSLIETLFLPFFKANREFIEKLFERNDHVLLGERIRNTILGMLKRDSDCSSGNFEMIELLLEYHISALMGVVRYWLKLGRPISERELLEIIYSVSFRGVFNMIRDEMYGSNLEKEKVKEEC